MSVFTRRLFLLRHAEADQPLGVSDHARPLTERGQKQGAAVGAYLAQEGLVPEFALVSTALRTRSTWDEVQKKLGGPMIPVEFEQAIYEARPHAILEAIQGLPSQPRSILLLGHNPGMHSVALQLTGAGDQRMRDRLSSEFPPASLAVIEFDSADWGGIDTGSGRLERFAIPSN